MTERKWPAWPFIAYSAYSAYSAWPEEGPRPGKYETVGWFSAYDARAVHGASSECTRYAKAQARAMDPQVVRDNEVFNPRMY